MGAEAGVCCGLQVIMHITPNMILIQPQYNPKRALI